MELEELRRLRRAKDTMDRDYAAPLNVTELAKIALMSTAHFSRQFREAYSETPYSYLMTRRVERAKNLLRAGELSVTEVCLAVGATSLGSFTTKFTELVGVPPGEYQRRNRGSLSDLASCRAMAVTRPRKDSARVGACRV